MAEFKNIDEFKQAVIAGTLSQEDFLKIMKSFGSANDEVPSQFEGYKDKSTWRQDMLSAMESFKNTPQAKQYAVTILRDKAADRFVRNFKPFFNTLIQGADIATSLSQIKQGNQALKGLVQPSVPTPSGAGLQTINNQIAQAQRGSFDAARAVAPARQAANDEYNTNINNAKAIAGGQAGEFGSLAQSAANQRARTLMPLPQLVDQIRAREQARMDQLAGLKGQYIQQDDRNRLYGTELANQQYQTQAQLAGDLLRQGNTNLRNVFQTLPDNLLQSAGRLSVGMMPTTNPYDKPVDLEARGYQPKPIAYQGNVLDYADTLQKSIQDRIRASRRRPMVGTNPNLIYKDPNYIYGQ